MKRDEVGVSEVAAEGVEEPRFLQELRVDGMPWNGFLVVGGGASILSSLVVAFS